MTGEVIKQFLVGLGFDIDAGGLAAFEQTLQSTALKVAALGAAALAAGGAVVAAVQHIAGEYDQLDKLAVRFRTTAEAVDEFMDVGKVLGLSDEQTVGSLKSLDRAIGDTALGLGRSKAVFEEIGISVLDAAGKMRPTTEVMDELVAKFKTMERGKAIAVMERLGIDPALLKVFNADLEALRGDISAIEAAAGFDIGEAVAESKAFMGSWRGVTREIEKWKMLLSKLTEGIAVKLMPRFRANLDRLKQQIEGFRHLVMDHLGAIKATSQTVVEWLLRVIGFVSAAGARLMQAITTIVSGILAWWNRLPPGAQKIVLGIGLIVAAWKFLNLAFLKTPLGQILMLVAAIGLLVDDFLTWREGGDSLIDWGSTFGKTLQAIVAFVTFLTGAFLVGKGAMLAYGAAVAFVNGVTKTAQAMMLLFNASLWANPATLVIGGIVAAIALLATAVYMIWDHWQPFSAWWTGLWTGMVASVTAAWSSITGSASAAKDRLITLVSSAWETLTGLRWADIAAAAIAAWEAIPDAAGAILDRTVAIFSAIVDFLSGSFVRAWDRAGAAVDRVLGLLSSAAAPFSGLQMAGAGAPPLTPQPALLPSPQAAAAMTGGQQTVSQQTDIVVQGARDPEATARSIAREQGRVNADLVRNLRGAVR